MKHSAKFIAFVMALSATLDNAHLQCFYRQSSLTAKPLTKTTQKET